MNPFEKVTDRNLSNDEMKIASSSGALPSNMKNAEDKTYIAIICSNMYDIPSVISTDPLKNNSGKVKYSGNGEFVVDGEAIIRTGRENMYNTLITYFTGDGEESIDIFHSIILVEGIGLEKAVSLYRFLTLCMDKYPEIDFSIPEVYTEWVSEEGKNENLNTTGLGLTSTIL